MTPPINKDVQTIDYVIHYATIIGTLSLIYILNYLLKTKNNKILTTIGSLTLDRYNIIIACYNFIVVGIFSIIYYYISNYNKTSQFKFYGKPIQLTMLDCIYISLVTQTTVGYGHITYEGYWVKLLNIIQMISILFNITFIHF